MQKFFFAGQPEHERQKQTLAWTGTDAHQDGRLGCNCENLCLRTFRGAVVSDEASHVDGFAVDGEVPHAAHKVTIPDREILRQVGNTAEQQGSSQVQWPVGDMWKSG